MNAQQRRQNILTQLHEQGDIEIEVLAKELNVSNMTIRRDLTLLEHQNQVIRTFGGAIPVGKIVNDASFSTKENKFINEKKAIAKKALENIKDHSTILLDSGTTTLEIAKLLDKKEQLTVITNDIKIATVLMDTSVQVIIVGGVLQNSTGTILGALTEQQLKQFHVDIAFLGAHAIDIKAGITVPSLEKAVLKRLMIQATEKTIVVLDSSKFNTKSLMEVCKLSKDFQIITNKAEDLDYKMYEEKVNIEFVD